MLLNQTTPLNNYTQLRSYTGIASGIFQVDISDNISTDNIGTITKQSFKKMETYICWSVLPNGTTDNTEYQNNRYKNDEEFKIKTIENSKKYNEKNKDQVIEYQKQLQHKYRLALNILKKLIQNNEISSKYKDEIRIICT